MDDKALEELIEELLSQGYTERDVLMGAVGLDGYERGVGPLQDDKMIFDLNQDGKVSSADALLYARNKALFKKKFLMIYMAPLTIHLLK